MNDASINLAKSLSKAAAGKIPNVGPFSGPVVDYVFTVVFPAPTGPPSYFEEVYARITKIVQQALQQDKIDQVNAAIKNVLQALHTEYDPAKVSKNLTDKSQRKGLFKLLQKYDSTFLLGPSGMLSILKSAGSPPAAFGVYLAGVSVRIMLYQEMALVDPDQNTPQDWAKSSYGKPGSGTVARYVTEEIEYATRTWNDIKTKRKRTISVGNGTFVWQRRLYDDLSTTKNFQQYYEAMYKFLPGNDPQYRLAQAWENYKGPLARKSQAPQQMDFNAAATRAIDNYYNTRAIPELINEIGNPEEIMKDWAVLKDRPLPA